MKKFIKILPALILALCLAGCSDTRLQPDQGEGKAVYGEYRLPLIETTDIHGHIVSTTGNAILYNLAYIADKANDMRGQDKDHLLLLDGGDLYQGASVSNLLGGRPIYIAIDKMGYDAVALGNHEFDWDFSTLVDPDGSLPDYEYDGINCVNDVPVLCANLYQNGNKVSRTRDYVIVEKTATNSKGQSIKVKVGIVGFAANYAGSIMRSKFTNKGYSIKNDYSIANDIALKLENSGQCDATILLIHGNAETAAEKLGKGSVIDLVLGGHSHNAISGTAESGIPYLQGGRYAECYAYSSLVFNLSSDGISFKNVADKKIQEVFGDMSGRSRDDFDQEVIDISDYALEATSRQMNDVVGFITIGATKYYLNGSGGRATSISNWMCEILRKIGDADISFVNGGGIRTTLPLNGQDRRDITVSTVYELFPFGNTTYVYDITYADLLQLLEYSLTESGSALFSYMTGIDCHYRGRKVIRLKKSNEIIYQDGQWAKDWRGRTLTLAVSEFLATSTSTDPETRLSNPLPGWNNTSRLLFNSDVDNENAVRVLREEAATSNGHLYIDTKPYYILED